MSGLTHYLFLTQKMLLDMVVWNSWTAHQVWWSHTCIFHCMCTWQKATSYRDFLIFILIYLKHFIPPFNPIRVHKAMNTKTFKKLKMLLNYKIIQLKAQKQTPLEGGPVKQNKTDFSYWWSTLKEGNRKIIILIDTNVLLCPFKMNRQGIQKNRCYNCIYQEPTKCT